MVGCVSSWDASTRGRLGERGKAHAARCARIRFHDSNGQRFAQESDRGPRFRAAIRARVAIEDRSTRIDGRGDQVAGHETTPHLDDPFGRVPAVYRKPNISITAS